MASAGDNERAILLAALAKPATALLPPQLQVLGVPDMRDAEDYDFEGAKRGDVNAGLTGEKAALGKKWTVMKNECEKRGVMLQKVEEWDERERDEGKMMRVFS